MPADEPRRPLRISGPEDFARTFGVSRETLDRLGTYEALLRQWQRTINLVAPNSLDDIWHRHFADSAQLCSDLPAAALRVLDLGSGAGFPGLVLAILIAGRANSPQSPFRVSLIESDTRKAAFLGEVARRTGVAVDIRAARIEKMSTQDKVGRSEVITARALAPLPRLLELMAPVFSADTVALLLKGREAEAEIEEARRNWSFDCERKPSLTDAGGRVLVIRNLQAKTEG